MLQQKGLCSNNVLQQIPQSSTANWHFCLPFYIIDIGRQKRQLAALHCNFCGSMLYIYIHIYIYVYIYIYSLYIFLLSRCPTLTHDHRRRRCVWARRHWNWNHQYWFHVIFVDESRFSHYRCDDRARVRRHVGERLVDCCIQEKDGNVGPSLMVWGAFHASGASEPVVLDGTVNQQRYIGILRQNLLPWARATFQRNFVLVQGNATRHTARNTRNFLAGEEVKVMQWPARNPDLNPIGHIWDQMGMFIRDMDNPPTTVARLREARWLSARLQ